MLRSLLCILLVIPVTSNILCYHTNLQAGNHLGITENNSFCSSIFDIASGSNVLRGSGRNATERMKNQRKDCRKKVSKITSTRYYFCICNEDLCNEQRTYEEFVKDGYTLKRNITEV